VDKNTRGTIVIALTTLTFIIGIIRDWSITGLPESQRGLGDVILRVLAAGVVLYIILSLLILVIWYLLKFLVILSLSIVIIVFLVPFATPKSLNSSSTLLTEAILLIFAVILWKLYSDINNASNDTESVDSTDYNDS
jgi:hypothetical protein